MFCTRCGMKCRDDARFCPRCGKQLISRSGNIKTDPVHSGGYSADMEARRGTAGVNDENEALDEEATLLIGSGQQRYRKLTGEPDEAAGYTGREYTRRELETGGNTYEEESSKRGRGSDAEYYDSQRQGRAGAHVRNEKKHHTVRNVLIILILVLAAVGASGGYFVYMAVQPRHALDTFLAAVEAGEWSEALECIEWEGQEGMSREEFEGYLNSRAEEIREWSSSTKVRCKEEDRGDGETSVTVMISKKGMQLAAPERELQMVRSEERQLFFFRSWKLTPQSAALLLGNGEYDY
ncbi:zinc-ribbon domain-containing protein [Murimonas intestini]|uniref:zinc-ribbon domain-containing protein n=1 Tax=Murimonas intestini TaxID=1337051 RepID=UPI0011DDFED7|nr:zinc-ribbon domain-containing protein [Murimonas intestini]